MGKQHQRQMKITFFSDIHGNHYAFHSFQRQMELLQPNQVVFSGDVFGYYYGQEEILNQLRNSGYICLLGNHDQMFLDMYAGKQNTEWLCARYGSSYRRNLGAISKENRDFLKSLPTSWELKCDDIQIKAFHGTPQNPLEGRLYPDTKVEDVSPYTVCDYLFLGHTHHKMIRQVGHTAVINPGSLGQQRDGLGCSYVLFDTCSRKAEFFRIDYPVSALITEIREKDPDMPGLIEVLQRRPKRMCQ